jgi:hypothetical protein
MFAADKTDSAVPVGNSAKKYPIGLEPVFGQRRTRA